MRIATSQYHATMNSALQAANTGLTQVMQQMSSSKRILKPSDDTIATVRLSRLTREEAALDQYRNNISALQSRLQTSEVTLDSVSKDMLMARDLLVWAADGANTDSDLAAMAGSLEVLRDSMFYTANTSNAEGKYLFSGTASDQPTLTRLAGPPASYVYGGNTDAQNVAVGDQVSLAANTHLQEMAGFLTQLETLVAALNAPGVSAGGVRATVDASIVKLDDTLSAVSRKIGELGGRQNILRTLDDNHAAVSLANQQSALELASLDYGEAATRLSSYTLAVEASQKAYAKVSGLSLFNAF